MATAMTTDEFLSHKKLALLRLAPHTPVMGVKMEDELRPKGFDVRIAYLSAGASDTTLDDVKDAVEGAIIAVPKTECEAAVKEAIEAKIPRIWIQAGCQSKEAIALCEQNGVPLIHGACVLMYAQPVKSVHAFHRGLWKLFGLLKK